MFLVSLLALTAVSAAENATDDIAITDDTVHEELDISTDEILTGNPTIADLNNTINGNENPEITLNSDYTYNEDSDSGFKDGIKISRDLTINGNAHIIDGGGKIRIFNTESCHVTIKNLTFINGHASEEYGGAIYLASNNNAAFYNCIFMNNSAGQAGAIYLTQSDNATFSNCIFMNNSADNGGAIYGFNSDDSSISDCTFIGNNGSYGGAINWYNGNNISISNCDFANNAANTGGAVFWSINTGAISGCIFINHASTSCTIYSYNIVSANRNLKINNNLFINNNGSPIKFQQSDATSNTNCNWFGNNATNYNSVPDVPQGSLDTWFFLNATANPNPNTYLNTTSVVFDLYAYNSTSKKVYYVTFSRPIELSIISNEGTADKKTAYIGETIRFTPTILKPSHITAKLANTVNTIEIQVTGESFSELKNLIDSAEDGSTITLEKDYLYSDEFDENGILIKKNITINANGHIIDGAGEARIFHVVSGNVIFQNMILINAHTGTGGHGGAIWAESDANVSAINCEFSNNSASYGGAMHGGSAVNCTFNSNYAYSYGGAIDDCFALGCTFNSNYVMDNGDGGAASGGKAINCTFNSNHAYYGGAIYKGAAINCTFNSNYAHDGGAMYTPESYKGEVINCTFNSNHAYNNGGALCDHDAINCTFNSNHAGSNGGAMHHKNKANAYDCSFVSNNATNGGATSNTDATLCVFEGNEGSYGGAMYSGKADSCIFKTSTDTLYETTLVAPTLTVNNATYEYGSTEKYVLNLTTESGIPITDANIKISVYYKNNNSWVGNYSCISAEGWVADMLPGIYIAFFDTEYSAFNPVNATITIIKGNSTLTVNNTEFNYGETGTVDVSFTNALGIIANVTDHDEAVIIVKGNVIAVSNLPAGTYTISVTTIVNETCYNNVTRTAKIIVKPASSSLNISNVELDYGSTVNVTATTEGALGITAKIDGKEINTTGNIITISGLDGGIHTLTVTTVPDENHTAVTKTVNITVNRFNSAITASNNAYVINYGGAYSAILKDSNGQALSGKQITFTLNGKNIGSAVTNAQGVANIKLTAAALKTAKAGAKNLVIKFAGDAKYNGATKTVKITINKEKTKIVAKKKTFKKSLKVKKYTITLKNSKNKAVKKVQVTIKIGKKTYKAKTNNKGKATFKIKKLTKKGKFTATIKFKGNQYYKAVSKKVKITNK